MTGAIVGRRYVVPMADSVVFGRCGECGTPLKEHVSPELCPFHKSYRPNTRGFDHDPDYYFDPSQGGMTESEFFGGDIGDK